MKIKRITLELEVPIRTIEAVTILRLVQNYLDTTGIPHQAQVEARMSPNTRIGNITEWEFTRGQ
jgi:hypothetical protein